MAIKIWVIRHMAMGCGQCDCYRPILIFPDFSLFFLIF